MRITVGGILLVGSVVGATAYFALDTSRINGAVEKVHGVVNGTMSLVGLFKSGAGTTTVSPEPYSPPPPFPAGGVDSAKNTVSTASATLPSALPVANTSVSNIPVVAETPTPTPLPTKSLRKRRKRGTGSIRKKTASPEVSETTAASTVPSPSPVPRKKGLRRRRKAVKAVAKPANTGGASTPKNGDLMGTYVSLELITGRSVQGILEGKTATHYVLNVPGLGPLEYPLENVKSIQPAK